MSRVPRSKEHLKAGFASEAAAAARYRSNARAAIDEGKPNLAQRWQSLAEAKDELAILQLAAAEPVRASDRLIADALSEDRFENDVVYPKMIRDSTTDAAADVFREVVAAQARQIEELEDLRKRLQTATGDID